MNINISIIFINELFRYFNTSGYSIRPTKIKLEMQLFVDMCSFVSKISNRNKITFSYSKITISLINHKCKPVMQHKRRQRRTHSHKSIANNELPLAIQKIIYTMHKTSILATNNPCKEQFFFLQKTIEELEKFNFSKCSSFAMNTVAVGYLKRCSFHIFRVAVSHSTCAPLIYLYFLNALINFLEEILSVVLQKFDLFFNWNRNRTGSIYYVLELIYQNNCNL